MKAATKVTCLHSTHLPEPAFSPPTPPPAPQLWKLTFSLPHPHPRRHHIMPSVSSALLYFLNSCKTPSPPLSWSQPPVQPCPVTSSVPAQWALAPWPLTGASTLSHRSPSMPPDSGPHEQLTGHSCGPALPPALAWYWPTPSWPRPQTRASKPLRVNRALAQPLGPCSRGTPCLKDIPTPPHPHLHPVYSLLRGINFPVRLSPPSAHSPL